MVKSPILFLLLSSALCFLGACRLTKVDSGNICSLALDQRIKTASYNTKIDFYQKHLSGLLVFKAINDSTKRAVFITQTGFKFFDFEFTPGTFAVRYCLPALNKKPVIAIFKRDFGLLLNIRKDLPSGSTQKDSLITYIFASEKNKFDYLTVNQQCGKLKKIESGGRCVRAVSIGIDGMKKDNFDSIHIIHKTLGLKIEMKQIEQ